MKTESKFEEYDDNKLSHTEQGPDYGNRESDLKWSCDYYSPKFKLPIQGLKYKIYNIFLTIFIVSW